MAAPSTPVVPSASARLLSTLPVAIPYYANPEDVQFVTLPPTATPLSNQSNYQAVGDFVDVIVAVCCRVTASAAVANRIATFNIKDQLNNTIYQLSSPQVQTANQVVDYSWAWGVSTSIASAVGVTMPLFPTPLVAPMRAQVFIAAADAGDSFTQQPVFTVLRFQTETNIGALESAFAAPVATPVLA